MLVCMRRVWSAPDLESIAALGKLRTITGSLVIDGNPKLPPSDVDWLLARVSVGGQTP